jgi:hypothetical protein
MIHVLKDDCHVDCIKNYLKKHWSLPCLIIWNFLTQPWFIWEGEEAPYALTCKFYLGHLKVTQDMSSWNHPFQIPCPTLRYGKILSNCDSFEKEKWHLMCLSKKVTKDETWCHLPHALQKENPQFFIIS